MGDNEAWCLKLVVRMRKKALIISAQPRSSWSLPRSFLQPCQMGNQYRLIAFLKFHQPLWFASKSGGTNIVYMCKYIGTGFNVVSDYCVFISRDNSYTNRCFGCLTVFFFHHLFTLKFHGAKFGYVLNPVFLDDPSALWAGRARLLESLSSIKGTGTGTFTRWVLE